MSDDVYSFKPASKKQWAFLNNTEAQIIVYGGAMGGGKTYNGLLKHLKWVDNKHYRGLVVRKTSSTIMKSGFLFDEAKGLYTNFDPNVKVKYKAQKFEFPSGAEIVFTHCATDADAEQFRGGQFSFILCDESTELEENHVLRLFSRIRSKAGIPPQMVLTANPNPDSFLRKWIDWYLLPEGHSHAGRADPDKDGKMRYFLRINDEMCWGDSKEELIERYGNPALPEDHEEQVKPISFCFYPATIFDNPPLIKLNPMYLANLMSLKEIQKERDLWGNWDIREANSTLWERSWCEEIYSNPDNFEIEKIVRAWDFASNLPAASNPSPDYTASVKMAKLKNGDFVILDVTRHRIRPGDWLHHVYEIALKDGTEVDIIIPLDPGAAAKAGIQQVLVRPLIQLGFTVRSQSVTQKKLDRFRPFSSACQNGMVKILKNCGVDYWNKINNDNSFWYKELEAFTGERKRGEIGHDDVVDCCSEAFMILASRFILNSNFLQTLKATDLSCPNPLLNIQRGS